MKQSLLTIFIPTGGRQKSLRKVLKCLSTQSFKKFEVLVVDFKYDSENKNLCNFFKNKINIQYLIQNKKGICNAANIALSKSKTKYFARIDDDVLIPKNWAKNIINNFRKSNRIGAVTGPTIIPRKYLLSRDLFYFENKFKKGNLFFRLIGKIYFSYFLENNPYKLAYWFKSGAFSIGSNFINKNKKEILEVDNLEACNFTVKTSILKKIKGFDEGFVGACEYNEADISFKVKRLKYKIIYNTNCALKHLPSCDGFYKERPESFSRMTNFIKFYFRHIKPNTLDKFFRFSLYLCFLNCYYLYRSITNKQVNQLGAIPGTFWGIIINLKEL